MGMVAGRASIVTDMGELLLVELVSMGTEIRGPHCAVVIQLGDIFCSENEEATPLDPLVPAGLDCGLRMPRRARAFAAK